MPQDLRETGCGTREGGADRRDVSSIALCRACARTFGSAQAGVLLSPCLRGKWPENSSSPSHLARSSW